MGDKSPKDKAKGQKQKETDRLKAEQKAQSERDAKSVKAKK